MGIGAGIFLIVVGAIFTFAVDFTISGLDIAVIGVILMIAGAAGLVLDLAVFAPRRRRVSEEPQRPYIQDRPYVEEHPYVDDTYGDPAADRQARVRRRVTTDHRPTR